MASLLLPQTGIFRTETAKESNYLSPAYSATPVRTDIEKIYQNHLPGPGQTYKPGKIANGWFYLKAGVIATATSLPKNTYYICFAALPDPGTEKAHPTPARHKYFQVFAD